jgi:hypothetical protein
LTDKEKAANALLGLLILPLIITLRGFVLVHLWAWFILPFGIRAISIPEAAGLALILQFVGSRSPSNEEFQVVHDTGMAVGIALMAWGIGYVIHLFVY